MVSPSTVAAGASVVATVLSGTPVIKTANGQIALIALLIVFFVVLPILSYFAYRYYYAARGRGRRR